VELPAEEENKDGADINLEEDNELDEQFDDLEGVDPSGTAQTKDDLWIKSSTMLNFLLSKTSIFISGVENAFGSFLKISARGLFCFAIISRSLKAE